MPGLFVVPRVQLKAAFNKYGATFLQILAGNLCLTSPERHIDKGRFLVFMAFLGPMAGDRLGVKRFAPAVLQLVVLLKRLPGRQAPNPTIEDVKIGGQIREGFFGPGNRYKRPLFA